MDLRNHINLLCNHQYDGWIAIYKGPDNIGIKKNTVVVVKNQSHYEPNYNRDCESCDWLNSHRTMEIPLGQDEIEKIQDHGSLIKTVMTTTGVPTRYLDRVFI